MKVQGIILFLFYFKCSSATKVEVKVFDIKTKYNSILPFVDLVLAPIHKKDITLGKVPVHPDAYEPLTESDIHKSEVAYEKLNKIWSTEDFVRQIDPYYKEKLGPFSLKAFGTNIPVTLKYFVLSGLREHNLYSFAVRGKEHPNDRVDKSVIIPRVSVLSSFELLNVEGDLRLNFINVTLNSTTQWNARANPVGSHDKKKLQLITALDASVDVDRVELQLWVPYLWQPVVSCNQLVQLVVDFILDNVLQGVADQAVKEWNDLVLAKNAIIPDD